MFTTLRDDLRTIFEKDPAARTTLEVILTYPGLHAIWNYRFAHKLWNLNFKFFARWIAYLSRFYTGIEIHPAAKIGKGFFIDHGMGVVIGETAEVGDNVMLYHNVTLGGVTFEKGKRHPTIEDNVIIGAGAKVLGPITIGKNSRIGANAVVVKSAPPNSVVVGVPGQIIVRSKAKPEKGEMDERHMPDAIGASMASVLRRLDTLEASLKTDKRPPSVEFHPPEDGVWKGEDFSI